MEFLNSLQPSGLPPHHLLLKEGVPVMLMRNMNEKRGLANGTILVCKEFKSRVIRCVIANGEKHQGETVLLRRMPIHTQDKELPFQFSRLQFPIKPAYAMTINKAQGQTLRFVGIFLPKQVFSHGQLYVALSRVGSEDCLILTLVDSSQDATPDLPAGYYVLNIVHAQALR